MDEVIKFAESSEEVESCYPVLVQLHEDLSKDGFIDHFRRLEGNGYRLAYLAVEKSVKVVASFHFGESFSWKKYLYVDDLVADSASRSKGYGAKLISWLYEYARQHGCNQMHLDTRVTRYATHKFYLNQGLFIGGYHFLRSLE